MSIRSMQAEAPAARAAGSDAAGPESVTTVRLWTGSLWRSTTPAPRANSAEIAAIASVSRPSEKLGTPRSNALALPSSDQQLAGAHQRLAIDAHRGLHHHAVEVHRHLNRAADRRRGAEGDVHRAEDLLVLDQVARQGRLLVGADPELGDVGAIGPVDDEQLHELLSLGPRCAHQVTVFDGEHGGLGDRADLGDGPVDDQGSLSRALDRGDEPLAAGQVAEGARGGDVTVVGNRLAVAQPEPQIGSVGAGDLRLRSPGE